MKWFKKKEKDETEKLWDGLKDDLYPKEKGPFYILLSPSGRVQALIPERLHTIMKQDPGYVVSYSFDKFGFDLLETMYVEGIMGSLDSVYVPWEKFQR